MVRLSARQIAPTTAGRADFLAYEPAPGQLGSGLVHVCGGRRSLPGGDSGLWGKRCVFYYCRTYYKAVCVGGRIVEDMCYERRRAEACVD
jgi:hypothetical protein